MKCKAFDVQIELEVQAVTCPGVWLCSNGKVAIQIYLLGLCTQTSIINPVFPLLYNEKFSFRKNFPNVQNLFELDLKLNKEVVYMELIQWEDCDTGNVLATFKTSLMELLYPCSNRKGVLAGVDVDLLMEATRKFPGIISPKVEISTKITIKEILCSVKHEKKNEVVVVNPKLISSKCVPKRHTPMRQKKVCHTYKYHRAKTNQMLNCNYIEQCTANDSLPSSSRQHSKISSCGLHNDDNLNKKYVHEKIQKIRNCDCPGVPCNCKRKKMLCPVCANYKYIFDSSTRLYVKQDNEPQSKLQNNKEAHEAEDKEMNNKCRCKNKTTEKCLCNPSLKTKIRINEIHERLKKSMSTPSHTSLEEDDNIDDGDTCCNKFYRNLEQFYKQLYIRAHHKVKNERKN